MRIYRVTCGECGKSWQSQSKATAKLLIALHLHPNAMRFDEFATTACSII